MKATIGSVGHVYGTIAWDGEQYRVTGQDRAFLAREIPRMEERLGVSGAELIPAIPRYFGGADKWVKLEA
jgi:hypothetical protein